MNRQRHCFIRLYRWTCNFRHVTSNVSKSGKNLYNLCKHFGIHENVAEHLSIKHPVLNKIDESSIIKLIRTVYDLGYSKEVLIEEPQLFGILPVTIKFRHQVLTECGFINVSPGLLISYLTVMRQKPIGELKKSGLIPNILNVENRLASCMTQWPTSLTSSVWGDINNLTLYSVRLQIIQRYLELMIDLPVRDFARSMHTYPTLRHRPLGIINETLNILQSIIMMPAHKIRSNMYLVHGDPDNLKNILYKFRSIGGIDIKEVIKLHPKIAMKNYNTLIEIRNVLKEYEISDEAQIRCFNIYTLSSSTVRERLEKARNIPEFKTFVNHPRFLKMIHYNNTAIKRLQKLYSNNKKCLSLNILTGSSAHYEVYEKAPGDRLGKGKDLVFCISQSLGNKYKKSDIRNAVKRHPFWINIPLVQVEYVYKKLSCDFTPNDIFENCSILLYPWNKIKDMIISVNMMQSPSKPSYFHETLDISTLSKSQKLSLVLYALEKDHYFTGNGVWNEEKAKTVVVC